MYFYTNLLDSKHVNNIVTVKKVSQINIHNKQSVGTQEIWDDLKKENFIVNEDVPVNG